MEIDKTMASLTLIFSLLLVLIASASHPAAAAFTNHTVGGSAGWFFNTTTNTSSTDYSAWAANQTFNLGDFLRTELLLPESDDGMQCQQGMAFEITVKHGSGLPPSLNQPPPPAYVEPPSSGDDSQSPPITINVPPPSDNGVRAAGANVRWLVAYVLSRGLLMVIG